MSEPYYRPANSGPDCSTARSARLRERRFQMAYEPRSEPPEYSQLAAEARRIFLAAEDGDPAMARALALRHVVEHCPITIQPDTVLLGGEDPFFFNLLLPTLQADRYSREGRRAPDEVTGRLRDAKAFYAPVFEGHVTPGIEFVLDQGIAQICRRAEDHLRALREAPAPDPEKESFYQAAVYSCESVLIYARRYREAAARLAAETPDPMFAAELRQATDVLARVPECPAGTLQEALQSFWLVYVLITLEMGGCTPGGGMGLGRLDQFLYPYYQRAIESGRVNRPQARAQALELLELFLLAFRHVDYYTAHQIYTPGSQASLGGVTPAGLDASNELTELILEASLRIANPGPFISVRLHHNAPERYWQVAASYALGGLGFPIVNDEAIIPSMLRHGRALRDARDYICSCCYEHTIPGREEFYPAAVMLNLPFVLELALNGGRSLLSGENFDCAFGHETPGAETFVKFDDLMTAIKRQLHEVSERVVALANGADRAHSASRRYPLMSLFVDDCLARGQDICAGGARYNLSGFIVAGLPTVVNALGAIRERVYRQRSMSMADLMAALRADFAGPKGEPVRRQLLGAPKWGNGDERIDDLAAELSEMLYDEISPRVNARGGRWQLGLHSWIQNVSLGEVVGASADGRKARAPFIRNMNAAWGTDLHGPTAVLHSLSQIDLTAAPNGEALDLDFDPALFQSADGRAAFVSFLKAFVELGIMEMQLTLVDTATLLAARENPAQYPHLLVRAAGYSARFIDLPPREQDEIIGRTAHASYFAETVT